MYTGSELPLTEALAEVTAINLTIMVFGAAMPMLYLAGIILCVVQYWSNKFMLFRYYRTPPKYDLQLVLSFRRLIEWSTVLHFFIATYMLSSPELMSPPSTRMAWSNEPGSTVASNLLALTCGFFMNVLLRKDVYRFNTFHGRVYLAFSFWFFVIFWIQRSKLLTGFLNWRCCRRCLKSQDKKVSLDLYADLRPQAL